MRALLRALLRPEPSERITAADARPPTSTGCTTTAQSSRGTCRGRDRRRRASTCGPSPWCQPGFDFIGRQGVLSSRGSSAPDVDHPLRLAVSCLAQVQVRAALCSAVHGSVPVTRKRLQLVGIGALCLTCKHEGVMIPNMNDFIYICDNAYELDALLQIEVEILSRSTCSCTCPRRTTSCCRCSARSARRCSMRTPRRSSFRAFDRGASAAAPRPGALPRRPARWRRACARRRDARRAALARRRRDRGRRRRRGGGGQRKVPSATARAGCAVLTSGRP